uniref:TOBE domain-containing protein n=1 Tax=Pseudomonas sp. TaxID=306 RepID=UPI0028A72F76
GDRVVLDTGTGLELASPASESGAKLFAGSPACIAVRPELIAIAAASTPPAADVQLSGVVEDRIYLGNLTEYRVRTGPFGVVCVRVPRQGGAPQGDFEHGAAVSIGWDQAKGLAMTV